MIDITEHANRVLGVLKAKYGLKDKSATINFVVREYEEEFLEPELRPEYKKKLDRLLKGRYLTRKEFERVVRGP